jgi:hypothetical protein
MWFSSAQIPSNRKTLFMVPLARER